MKVARDINDAANAYKHPCLLTHRSATSGETEDGPQDGLGWSGDEP
jgi:hypothetical protein